MQWRCATDKERYKSLSTQELRESFLVDNLFTPGQATLLAWEVERSIVGGFMPMDEPLNLDNSPLKGLDFFCQRRELGIINLGGPGLVSSQEASFELTRLDGAYFGKGSRDMVFKSLTPQDPARFYLASYPAHEKHPASFCAANEARLLELGEPHQANVRTIRQYIHPEGLKSSQLVMGVTQLAPGSVWNTMPPHTHQRRSEIYFYFDLDQNQRIVHLMGEPEQTRHLIVANDQAVLSPSWSLHAGAGTKNYSFIWAMGGENQLFDDMDAVAMNHLQ